MLHLTPSVVTTLGIYTHFCEMLIGLRLSVDIFRNEEMAKYTLSVNRPLA